MRNVFIITVTSALILTSCKAKQDISKEAPASPAVAQADSVTTTASISRSEQRMEYCTGSTTDSLLLTIEKTPCYGRCPIYTAKVYCSGYVVYVGKNFTPRLGTYDGTMDQKDILEITEMADSIGYWSLKKEYDMNVTDLPSTITMVHYVGKKHSIRNRMGAPESLKGLEDLIESKLDQVAWTKKSSDH